MTRIASALTALLLLSANAASAQMDDDMEPRRSFESPEMFAIEFRVGPYEPDFGNNGAFNTFFKDDVGPMLELEIDVVAIRLDEILYLGAGAGIGTSSYDGKALDAAGNKTSEETTFGLVPLSLVGVLRVDALVEKLSVPFLLSAKLGYQWTRWDTDTGGSNEVDGWSTGIRYGFQIALDLDTFEESAARTMDEEWGINKSFLLLELYGFDPIDDTQLPVGDFTWTAGLGFIF